MFDQPIGTKVVAAPAAAPMAGGAPLATGVTGGWADAARQAQNFQAGQAERAFVDNMRAIPGVAAPAPGGMSEASQGYMPSNPSFYGR